jgi:3-hydroxyisobutyrate dehydrogenase-like beta-hydroxyacid dehydrogenase
MRGQVGVVGSGAMGTFLVHRLAAAGYRVNVYVGGGGDFEEFAWCGATEVDVPADAAEHADVVLVALPDERAVEDAVFDCGGVSETLPDHHAVLDLSSVSPDYTESARARMTALGLTWLEGALVGEATLTGSWPLCVLGAEQGAAPSLVLPVAHDLARHVEVRRGLTTVSRMRLALASAEACSAA